MAATVELIDWEQRRIVTSDERTWPIIEMFNRHGCPLTGPKGAVIAFAGEPGSWFSIPPAPLQGRRPSVDGKSRTQASRWMALPYPLARWVAADASCPPAASAMALLPQPQFSSRSSFPACQVSSWRASPRGRAMEFAPRHRAPRAPAAGLIC